MNTKDRLERNGIRIMKWTAIPNLIMIFIVWSLITTDRVLGQLALGSWIFTFGIIFFLGFIMWLISKFIKTK